MISFRFLSQDVIKQIDERGLMPLDQRKSLPMHTIVGQFKKETVISHGLKEQAKLASYSEKIKFLSKEKIKYYQTSRFGFIKKFFSALRNIWKCGTFTSSGQLGLELSEKYSKTYIEDLLRQAKLKPLPTPLPGEFENDADKAHLEDLLRQAKSTPLPTPLPGEFENGADEEKVPSSPAAGHSTNPTEDTKESQQSKPDLKDEASAQSKEAADQKITQQEKKEKEFFESSEEFSEEGIPPGTEHLIINEGEFENDADKAHLEDLLRQAKSTPLPTPLPGEFENGADEEKVPSSPAAGHSTNPTEDTKESQQSKPDLKDEASAQSKEAADQKITQQEKKEKEFFESSEEFSEEGIPPGTEHLIINESEIEPRNMDIIIDDSNSVQEEIDSDGEIEEEDKFEEVLTEDEESQSSSETDQKQKMEQETSQGTSNESAVPQPSQPLPETVVQQETPNVSVPQPPQPLKEETIVVPETPVQPSLQATEVSKPIELTPKQSMIETFQSTWSQTYESEKTWVDRIVSAMMNGADIIGWKETKPKEYTLTLSKEAFGKKSDAPNILGVTAWVVLKENMNIVFSEEAISNSDNIRKIISFPEQGISVQAGRGFFSKTLGTIKRIIVECGQENAMPNCTIEASVMKIPGIDVPGEFTLTAEEVVDIWSSLTWEK